MENDETESPAKPELKVLDFWAPWCGPCRAQGALLEKFESEIRKLAELEKVNVDENIEEASKWGVRSIPTLIVTRNGSRIHRFQGITKPSDIISVLRNLSENDTEKS